MRCPRGGGSRAEVQAVLFSKAGSTVGWQPAAVRRPVPESLGSDNSRDFAGAHWCLQNSRTLLYLPLSFHQSVAFSKRSGQERPSL